MNLKCRFALVLSAVLGVAACVEHATAPAGDPEPPGGSSRSETCASAGYCELEGITATATGTPSDQTSEEATCVEPTAPECVAPGGGGTSGGTGTSGPAPEDDEECDPAIHKDCERPLTAKDTATIRKALATKLRTTFTDSLARKDCEQLVEWFRDAMAAGKVLRGSFNSTFTNDPQGSHYGMYDPATGNLHLDPRVLDGAASGEDGKVTEVAITGLHEAAHIKGFNHGDPTFDAQGRDFYTEPYFSRLNPGPNSCVLR